MQEQKNEEEVKKLRERYLELKMERSKFNFHFPEKMLFPFTWTFFFAVVGVVSQSISEGTFVFFEFFSSNYISWFNSFGNFSSAYYVSGLEEVFYMMLDGWYYFFFTGGLISLIWASIRSFIDFVTKKKKDDFRFS